MHRLFILYARKEKRRIPSSSGKPKNKIRKSYKYLFLQGKKITDAALNIMSRTANYQVRQPVRKWPF